MPSSDRAGTAERANGPADRAVPVMEARDATRANGKGTDRFEALRGVLVEVVAGPAGAASVLR